ncbi:AraC family transcriptional regulator [Chitinophaga defluvii]|uniref:AraC family transcriptional regulator n=1 Tax=Chitinophaga defluvii TaxID=3163343 RepID=A0ABV2T627_9BACT
MRLLQTEITPLINDLFYIDVRKQPFLSSPFHAQPSFHAHPELELVFIVEGCGKRIINNKVEPFEAGDMVFVGSYVPHIWLSAPAFYEAHSPLESKAIVTYLNPKLFGDAFKYIREYDSIREMINQASRGIRILGETRKVIAEQLIRLSTQTGFEKVEGLLRILHLISVSSETSYIVDNHVDQLETADSDRLITVIKYIKEHLHQHISLKEIAAVACMKKQSFCRYFKSRTKKSFSHYLEELRMEYAKKLLLEDRGGITDVAHACGYISTSHFCKVFKDYNGKTPYQYKISINKGLVLKPGTLYPSW